MYLAPALVIMNSEEFRNLTHHVSFTDSQFLYNSFAFDYCFWFSILIMYCYNPFGVGLVVGLGSWSVLLSRSQVRFSLVPISVS